MSIRKWWIEKTSGGYGVIKSEPPVLKKTVIRPGELMNDQERELKILQGEAWDEGYAAAIRDLRRFYTDNPKTENPFVIWTEE